MTMRMLLVGLVAALGVTIPTPTQCSHWWLSVRNVGSAALADWDHWTPRGKNELPSVISLPPVAAHERLTGDQVCDRFRQRVASPGCIAQAQAIGARLIAANHMKLPTTDDVASHETSKTWADLPANVFEKRAIVFEPMVISGDLNAGVAYDLNRMADGIGIKPPTGGGAKIATGPSKPPGALPRLAVEIKNEPAPARNPFAADLAIVPLSRIDNLDAGLWAGLIQSAEHVLAEDRVPSSSTPVLAQSSSQPESGLPGGPNVTPDEWIECAGTDLIAADSAWPDPSDPGIADEEAGSMPILGADRAFDPALSPDLLPWSQAQAYDRRDSEPVVAPAQPLSAPDAVSKPEISLELKQAILLTKDALNAWVNLVRRGSVLKVTKR